MQSFTHKNVQITLDYNGQFTATVRGKVVHKPSLDAMKKFIDTPPAFTPFKALRTQYGEAIEIEVVGIKKDRSRYGGGRLSFRCKNQNYEFDDRTVIEDTAENRALLTQIQAKAAEARALNERMNKELEALREKLVVLNPDSFLK